MCLKRRYGRIVQTSWKWRLCCLEAALPSKTPTLLVRMKVYYDFEVDLHDLPVVFHLSDLSATSKLWFRRPDFKLYPIIRVKMSLSSPQSDSCLLSFLSSLSSLPASSLLLCFLLPLLPRLLLLRVERSRAWKWLPPSSLQPPRRRAQSPPSPWWTSGSRLASSWKLACTDGENTHTHRLAHTQIHHTHTHM